MSKRLYRSVKDRKLAGVCGGLADYFEIDSSLVRLAMVLLACLGGGVLVYIVAWIIVPEEVPMAPSN